VPEAPFEVYQGAWEPISCDVIKQKEESDDNNVIVAFFTMLQFLKKA
jgi:hypothetical protein